MRIDTYYNYIYVCTSMYDIECWIEVLNILIIVVEFDCGWRNPNQIRIMHIPFVCACITNLMFDRGVEYYIVVELEEGTLISLIESVNLNNLFIFSVTIVNGAMHWVNAGYHGYATCRYHQLRWKECCNCLDTSELPYCGNLTLG